MHGLQARFSDQIDFIHLDIDRPEATPIRDAYGLYGRSQYLLIDAAGNELAKWFGPLNEDQVAAQIESALAQLAAAP